MERTHYTSRKSRPIRIRPYTTNPLSRCRTILPWCHLRRQERRIRPCTERRKSLSPSHDPFLLPTEPLCTWQPPRSRTEQFCTRYHLRDQRSEQTNQGEYRFHNKEHWMDNKDISEWSKETEVFWWQDETDHRNDYGTRSPSTDLTLHTCCI